MSSAANAGAAFLIATCFTAFTLSDADAEWLHLSKNLTGEEARCLVELIRASHWADAPLEEQRNLMAVAKVGRADLKGDGRKEYVYLFEEIGWCGTGGCALVIGEVRKDGSCHLLYQGAGDNITVLGPLDNGYRRLYTPCEIRFDGRQYQQIHPDCPTLDTQH